MKTILLLSLITTSSLFAGESHRRPVFNHSERIDSCIIVEKEVIDVKIISKGECLVKDSLELKSTVRSYPLMPNAGALRVNYWEGSFTRETQQEISYSVNYYDICRGRKTLTLNKKYMDYSQKDYALVNPNLSDSISKSYLLAPMTDEEALASYEKLEEKCNKEK